MSSILKALKKLDKQSHQPKPDQPWPQIDTKQAINHRTRHFRFISRLVSSLVIVVIAVAGTWLFMSQKQVLEKKISSDVPRSVEKEKALPPPVAEKRAESKTADVQPAVSVSIPEKAVPDEKTAPTPVTPPQSQPAIPVKLPEGAAKMPDLPETSSKPVPPPVSVPEKITAPNIAPKPAPSTGLNETHAQMQKSRPNADAKAKPEKAPFLSEEKLAELEMVQDEIDAMIENVTPKQAEELKMLQDEIKHFKKTGKFKQDIKTQKPAPPAPAPEQETSSATPGDASRLKVQALVWSDDPGSRWAMVNDRIVRTGSSIEGATVTYIGEDHIIVREGGEEWKLKFQIK